MKYACVYCNDSYLIFEPCIKSGVLFPNPQLDWFDTCARSDNKLIGSLLLLAINAIHRFSDNEYNFYFVQSEQAKYIFKKRNLEIAKKYKKSSSYLNNMMFVLIYVKDYTLTLEPWEHSKKNEWIPTNGLICARFVEQNNDEILGAILRFAIMMCRGSGALAVRKILFPDGFPSSLEEYLASVNPDYEKYLIIQNN